MIAAIALAAMLRASPEATAMRIAEAFRAHDIHVLSGFVDPASREEWIDVVDVIDRSQCASVARVDAFVDSATPTAARAIVIIDGFSESAGTPHERAALPPAWLIDLDRHGGRWRIRAAKTAERAAALDLLGASTDDARAAIVDAARNPRTVVRIAADLMGRRGDALRANEELDRFLETRAAADPATAAYVRRMFSRSLSYNHEPVRAIEAARSAVALAETSGDRDVLAEAYFGLGMALWVTGDGNGANAVWSKGIALADVIDDPRIAIKCAHMSTFSPDKYTRLTNAETTDRLSRRYGWKEGIIDAEFARGEAYRYAREAEAAAGVYRSAVAESRKILHLQYERIATIGLAESAHLAGRFSEARRFFETALREHYPLQGFIAGALNEILLEQGELEQARKIATASAAERFAAGDHDAAALANLTIAEIDRRQGKYREALDVMAKVREILRLPSSSRSAAFPAWVAYLLHGEILRNLGRTDEAAAQLRNAIEIVDATDAETATIGTGSHFLDNKIAPYIDLIEILTEQRREREALSLSERVKARMLTSALASGGVDLSQSMTAEERETERSLTAELQRLNMARLRGDNVEHGLADAHSRFEQFMADLHARHPDLQRRRVEARADALEGLPGGTTILDYVVGQRRTTLFVITTGANPSVSAHAIKVSAKELERRVTRFVQLIAGRNERYAAEAAALYRLLIGPAHLGPDAAVGIIPDGVLWELPFQALRTRGAFLIDRHSVFYAVSLTALSRAMERRPRDSERTRRLLAVGDPLLSAPTRTSVQSLMRGVALGPLPDAEREVRAIGRLYGGGSAVVVTEGDARETTLKSLAPASRIIHIAAHAVPDNRQPMFSCIVLGRRDADPDDGILEAREVMDMHLPETDLTILSACDSGRGSIARGEGIVGLSWAFLAAGSRTTVVSQWSVASDSTAELMIAFHRNLLDGHAPPEALRRAELALRDKPRFAHPFYWAPFVVVGAPR
ncbi:MAG TPA: CHAT domain-containing tetratricopeptide repeat protein [Thermoanaerobaculia bacterium]|nr:CHAT domain-containing tetratricopeptide repeat protein [Thermoanaerobaculia bacterium]